ncbi:MAG TPA: DarT ssDNA thymidine ADP-ribosyltransferase family protein, partial [Pirellulaceae bacterium]|nr:DarT ssDNA thymidine ADP-ribosyltransferase family protein [Pirellulaceae bacterium]
RKDFQHDAEDPGKLGRYQAEALVHRQVPVEALLGIACYDTKATTAIQDEVEQLGLAIAVKAIPGWYF